MNLALGNLVTENTSISNGFPRSIPSLKTAFCVLCISLSTDQSYGANLQLASLTNLSLEELGDIKVTSVSKKEERLANAAASIYVITADAIRRSGARSLPDVLRLAPNLLVAQINANKYAISARGFNSSTANKLLVMIDSRTIYTPLYSGVFWDAQDVLLQDVDRIEVISGPGGTLWGANAVNGVINIITKQATATTGNFVNARSGNRAHGFSLRHGGNLKGDNGAYRIYAKADQWQHSVRASGVSEPDAWSRSQIGFRTDWSGATGDYKLQGDSYRNSIDQQAPGQQSNAGTNLLARWKQKLANGASVRVQTYIDHSTRNTPGTYSERLNTLDLDAQYSLPETEGKQLIWGGGYRASDDHVGNTAALAFLPADRKLHWANLFVQQERSLWPDLQLTLGGKLEKNDYTGTEFLPNLKLAWSATNNQLLWAGLARAVRAPSRIDSDLYAPGVPPYFLAGGPDFRSEIANIVELGWRAQQGQAWSYSVVVFHNQYDHLRSLNKSPSGVFTLGNDIEGEVDGLEVLTGYQITPLWTLEASALILDEHFSGSNLTQSSPGNDPRSQWTLSSRWNINAYQQLDISLRHVGKLPTPEVPSYRLLDIHFCWSISNDTELGISAFNLLDPYHQEFASDSGVQALNPIQIERELNMALTVKF